MTITVYNYWGNENEPPAHLKTKKQLAELGLRAVAPVGVIHTRKYDLYLYNPEDSASVAPKKQASPKQLENLAKGRRNQQYKAWYQNNYGWIYNDQNEAVVWAKELVTRDNWVLLDTETTGLQKTAQIVQIGIIDSKGEVILDSLIKPTITIPDEVIQIHGITNEVVVDAPGFLQIYPQIVEALNGKEVIIYNADFDTKRLNYCCKLHKLPKLKLDAICLMYWYAQYFGEWDDYWEEYRLQPLNGGHNAVSDCQAALKLIQKMADDSPVDLEKVFEEHVGKIAAVR